MFIIIYIAPFTTLLLCYGKVWFTVRDLANIHENYESFEKIVAKKICVLLAVFLVSWTPFFTYRVVAKFVPCVSTDYGWYLSLLEPSNAFAYLGSCLNPLIYAMITDDFKRDILTYLDTTKYSSRFLCCLKFCFEIEELESSYEDSQEERMPTLTTPLQQCRSDMSEPKKKLIKNNFPKAVTVM